MQLKLVVPWLAALATAIQATTLTIQNQCSESIALYDNSASETVASGGSTTRTLSSGFSGMFRNGVSAQATLAEFSITGGYTWYDISIIPTGSSGPGNCASLGECKAVTGGTGFNTPMQIAPSGCATVTCLEDGCADAGTNNRPSHFGSIDDPIVGPTTAPVTLAPVIEAPPTETPTLKPTTAAPTPETTTETPTLSPSLVPTQTPSSIRTTESPTPVPTEAPTETPTTAQVFKFTIPTDVPVTEEPTDIPTVVPIPTLSAPWESSRSSSSSTSSSGSQSEDTITFPPEGNTTQQAVASTTVSIKSVTIAPTSADSTGQTTITETASSSDTPVRTIVAATVGAVAVVGAIAAIIMVRRKKQQMDASALKDDLEWLDEFSGMVTPVTRIPTM
ncbi:hypothetical protein AM588_10002335 [Phytophthora nicotianae]|uniref:Uncharacterized protein n=1 Tax=Phytophthora nicotianae TaxID=4792 RepID=A0A0W8CWD0_PHYNI|nr:hypothetical protein AM588_10002335 [Phytophthora nicotianae]